ncbi:histidine kinase, partial [Acinetobacter baumannii]
GSQEDKDIIDMAQNVMKNQNELINQLNAKMEKAFETNTDILELANLGQMVDIIAHELARITENTSNLLIRLKNSEDNKEETSNIMNELRKQ